MRKKQFFSVLVLLFVITSFPVTVCASNVDSSLNEQIIDHFDYPITINSPNWFDYSVLEKVEMLKIPKSVLHKMSDDALLRAVAEYPYLCDIYLYGDSVDNGIDVSSSYFSALKELQSRDTTSTTLLNNAINIINEYSSGAQNTYETNSTHNTFVTYALADIINSLNNSYRIVYDNSVSTWTLDSTSFDYLLLPETHTTAEHDEGDEEIEKTYGVTCISRGSCQYNCHSYAWYSRSTTNKYWISDPSPFMESGDYTCISRPGLGTAANSTSIKYGDIIFYGDLNGNIETWHSAVYRSNSTTGNPIAEQLCRSKWGQYGVFEHKLANVPAAYDTSNISAWRAE